MTLNDVKLVENLVEHSSVTKTKKDPWKMLKNSTAILLKTFEYNSNFFNTKKPLKKVKAFEYNSSENIRIQFEWFNKRFNKFFKPFEAKQIFTKLILVVAVLFAQ